MTITGRAVQGTKALASVGWQLSVVPAQVVGRRMPPRGSAAFYALVAGSAVVGAVDWPVALLVTGAYIAARAQAPSLATDVVAVPSTRSSQDSGPLVNDNPADQVSPREAPVIAQVAAEQDRSGEELTEPWPGYATGNATEVIHRLDTPGVDLDHVLRYETQHRDRKTVLAAATERHQHSPGASR